MPFAQAIRDSTPSSTPGENILLHAASVELVAPVSQYLTSCDMKQGTIKLLHAQSTYYS